jgi:hypothetical protein
MKSCNLNINLEFEMYNDDCIIISQRQRQYIVCYIRDDE